VFISANQVTKFQLICPATKYYNTLSSGNCGYSNIAKNVSWGGAFLKAKKLKSEVKGQHWKRFWCNRTTSHLPQEHQD